MKNDYINGCMFSPDVEEMVNGKKMRFLKIKHLDSIVEEDCSIKKQYKLFLQDRKEWKKLTAIPPLRSSLDIQTASKNYKKESSMLTTTSKFKSPTPRPSFLAKLISNVIFMEIIETI